MCIEYKCRHCVTTHSSKDCLHNLLSFDDLKEQYQPEQHVFSCNFIQRQAFPESQCRPDQTSQAMTATIQSWSDLICRDRLSLSYIPHVITVNDSNLHHWTQLTRCT